MKYEVKILSDMALKLGVVRNTLEKVIRLSEILKFINSDYMLRNKLALKGGTAINLLYGDIPRLSVDIDLDYAINDDRESMMRNRKSIKNALETYFVQEGYVLNKNSRYSHILDAFVISYIPSGGGTDNIKVEINYSMRSHLLTLENKQLDLIVIKDPFSILTVSKIEIYAGKINALLSRNQIRDLFDAHQMIEKHLLTNEETIILKNVVLFYRYIQNDTLEHDPDFLQKYNKRMYVRDLLPVLRKGNAFSLEAAKETVSKFIEHITSYDEKQKMFIESVNLGNPNFGFLFEDEKMKVKAEQHPMSLWKRRRE